MDELTRKQNARMEAWRLERQQREEDERQRIAQEAAKLEETKKRLDEEAQRKKEAENQQLCDTAKKEKESVGNKVFTYKELVEIRAESLKNPHIKTNDMVDMTKLETYLSDLEFQKVFQTDRISFAKYQEWKKVSMKKKAKLF